MSHFRYIFSTLVFIVFLINCENNQEPTVSNQDEFIVDTTSTPDTSNIASNLDSMIEWEPGFEYLDGIYQEILKAASDDKNNNPIHLNDEFFDYSDLNNSGLPEEYKSFYIDENGNQADFQDRFDTFINELQNYGFPQEVKVIVEKERDSDYRNILYIENITSIDKDVRKIDVNNWFSTLDDSSKYAAASFLIEDIDYFEGFLDIYGRMYSPYFDDVDTDEEYYDKYTWRETTLTVYVPPLKMREFSDSRGYITDMFEIFVTDDSSILELSDVSVINDIEYHIFLISMINEILVPTNLDFTEDNRRYNIANKFNFDRADIIIMSSHEEKIIFQESFDNLNEAKLVYQKLPDASNVPFSDAKKFMIDTTKADNKVLLRSFYGENPFSPTQNLYYFLSKKGNTGCITLMTPILLNILQEKCDDFEERVMAWEEVAPRTLV